MPNLVEVFYVYAEVERQLIIHAKHGKSSELSISEIASAGFSGIIQQTLVDLAVTRSAGPVLLPLYNCVH